VNLRSLVGCVTAARKRSSCEHLFQGLTSKRGGLYLAGEREVTDSLSFEYLKLHNLGCTAALLWLSSTAVVAESG